MTRPVRHYLVMVPDQKAHIVEADCATVDDRGHLHLYTGTGRLVGSFSPGFWQSCTEQPEKFDG